MKNKLKMLLCNVAIASLFNATALHAQNITTVAGNGAAGMSGDGEAATSVMLSDPTSICTDALGNIFIANNHNTSIKKVNVMGIITTVAGSGIEGFAGNGGPATAAQLYSCQNVLVDEAGNIYINDASMNLIRKVDQSGIINTFAGTTSSICSGDGGPATAAGLTIQGMTFDPSGNLVIADIYNHRIRKINAAGIISTIAGTGVAAYTGDGGPATAAAFNTPMDVAYDAAGNLYISDNLNNVIRKVNTSGIITTYAGTGIPGYNGDDGTAIATMLYGPEGITVDATGNLLICDKNNKRLRKVSPSGTITTVAGNGSPSFSGDDGPATSAGIGPIRDVDIDNAGNIYITGALCRVRKIDNHSLQVSNTTGNGIQLSPNPTHNSIHITGPGKMDAVITGMDGKAIMNYTDVQNINVSNLSTGLYIVSLYNKQGVLLKQEKLVKE